MSIPHCGHQHLLRLLLPLTPQKHLLQIQGLLIPLLFKTPFVSTKTTDTKIEVTSFGICFISQRKSLQEGAGKAELKHMEKARELDLFSMPPASHASTLGTPTGNLNNKTCSLTKMLIIIMGNRWITCMHYSPWP